jgi:hypothetical protein
MYAIVRVNTALWASVNIDKQLVELQVRVGSDPNGTAVAITARRRARRC